MRLINHSSGFNRDVANSHVRPACLLGGRYHTIVEDHYEKDRLLNVLSSLWLFKSLLFKQRKKSLWLGEIPYFFLFIHVTIDSWISHVWSHHGYILTAVRRYYNSSLVPKQAETPILARWDCDLWPADFLWRWTACHGFLASPLFTTPRSSTGCGSRCGSDGSRR